MKNTSGDEYIELQKANSDTLKLMKDLANERLDIQRNLQIQNAKLETEANKASAEKSKQRVIEKKEEKTVYLAQPSLPQPSVCQTRLQMVYAEYLSCRRNQQMLFKLIMEQFPTLIKKKLITTIKVLMLPFIMI